MEGIDNLEMSLESDQQEFCEILRNLYDRDLAILNQVFLKKTEKEQLQTLRCLRSTNLNGSLYNAYCSRILVADPSSFVRTEIIYRFAQLHLPKTDDLVVKNRICS